MPRSKKAAKKKAFQEPRAKSLSPGKPRLDPHQRLLSRFYEPLILLHTLGHTRGDRTPCPSVDEVSTWPTCSLRRRLLDDLAYICDYDKGGDTVTALALESRPEGSVFWLAANTDPERKVKPFLKNVIDDLKRIAMSLVEGCEESKRRIARKCIEFGRRRIKKYWSLLKPLLKRCFRILKIQDSDKDRELAAWLENLQLHQEEPLRLCQLSYEERQSPRMKYLALRGQEHSYLSSEDSNCCVFRDIRHYIGRLGYHFRAAESLVAAACRLPHIFEDCQVQCLTTPPISHDPPAPDAKTRLDSVVVRMLPANAVDQVRDYQSKLAFMDDKFNLNSRFIAAYKDPKFRPRVHAELLLLEHFYAKRLAFADFDRYIGCSKPACYCCALYIRHHPGNFIEPASHQKIYLNWRPPDLVIECDAEARLHQRNILNAIIPHIRRDALHQISERSNPYICHPDSNTGITETLRSTTNIHTQRQTDDERSICSEHEGHEISFALAKSATTPDSTLSVERTGILVDKGSSSEHIVHYDSDSDGGVALQ